MSLKKAVSITVQGRVQGVGFRYFVKSTALRHGLMGYVMNQSDGTVYMEIEGNTNRIEEFISRCRKGPMLSEVIDVEIKEINVVDYQGFMIRK